MSSWRMTHAPGHRKNTWLWHPHLAGEDPTQPMDRIYPDRQPISPNRVMYWVISLEDSGLTAGLLKL